MVLHNFINLFIFGSSFSLITLALGIFYEKRSNIEKIVSFSLYFLWSLDAIFLLYENMGYYKIYPHLIYLNQPFEFFIGTFAYYFYKTKIEGRIKFNLLTVFLSAPGILAVLYFIPFFMQSPETKLASVGFDNIENGIIRNIYLFIMYSPSPWLIFCLILAVIHGYRMLSKKGISLIMHKKILMIYNILWIALIFGIYFSILFNHTLLIRIILIIINFMLIFFYHLEKKYADFFHLIQKDARDTRYKKSRIKCINTHAVIERIKELMELEYIYHNEKISLNELSGILNIPPHQLSEILNNELKMNFNTFINSYRIEEVKKRLIENKNDSIIHIAYQCGFNSKSVFNADFYKYTGMTPTEFKKKFKKNSPEL